MSKEAVVASNVIKVKVLKDFVGSCHGYDTKEYKKGDEVEITQSLYDSVGTVQNYGKDKKPLPVEHWVELIKKIKPVKESDR